MSTYRTSLVNYGGNSITLDQFKAVGLAINTAFSTFGWMQASDTGQVNWGTLNTLPAYHTPVLYEIWRMNDALQSSYPVFVKIYYKHTANSQFGFDIYIGDGSDGSGNITNSYNVMASASEFTNAISYGSAGITYDCLFSGNINRFCMLLWRNSSGPVFFNIERPHDDNGNDVGGLINVTTVYALFSTATLQMTQKLFCAYTPSTQALYSESFIPTVPCTKNTTAYNGYISIFPVANMRGQYQNPLLGCISVKAADFAELDAISVALYSSKTCSYIFSGLTNTGLIQQSFAAMGTNNGILMRYE